MWLHVTSGPDAGTSVALPDEGTFVLGRQRGCDLVVRDQRASRRHLELTWTGEERYALRDLDSANGTFVDGSRVEETVLEGGEDIRIGDVVLSVRRGAPAPTAEPVPMVTNRTPAGETAMAPRVATQSMVMRLVDAGTKRASRTGLLAGAGALVAAVAVVVVLLATGVIGGDDDVVPEVVAKVAPATVLIAAERDDTLNGTGSGWVLDAAEGLIVTNAHVVNQGTTFTVAADGRSRPAELVGSAPCEDIALLRVQDTDGLETAQLASSGSVSQGETRGRDGLPGRRRRGGCGRRHARRRLPRADGVHRAGPGRPRLRERPADGHAAEPGQLRRPAGRPRSARGRRRRRGTHDAARTAARCRTSTTRSRSTARVR